MTGGRAMEVSGGDGSELRVKPLHFAREIRGEIHGNFYRLGMARGGSTLRLLLCAAATLCGGVSRRGITVAAAAATTTASAATVTATTLLNAAKVYTVLTDSSPKLSSPSVQRARVDTLVDTCIHGKRAVFLGERHDSLADHLLQAELIQTVRPRRSARGTASG